MNRTNKSSVNQSTHTQAPAQVVRNPPKSSWVADAWLCVVIVLVAMGVQLVRSVYYPSDDMRTFEAELRWSARQSSPTSFAKLYASVYDVFRVQPVEENITALVLDFLQQAHAQQSLPPHIESLKYRQPLTHLFELIKDLPLSHFTEDEQQMIWEKLSVPLVKFLLIDAEFVDRGLDENSPIGTRPPVFVIGFPKCGSTFVQTLLTLDRKARTPLIWEAGFDIADYRDSTYEQREKFAEALMDSVQVPVTVTAHSPSDDSVIREYSLTTQTIAYDISFSRMILWSKRPDVSQYQIQFHKRWVQLYHNLSSVSHVRFSSSSSSSAASTSRSRVQEQLDEEEEVWEDLQENAVDQEESQSQEVDAHDDPRQRIESDEDRNEDDFESSSLVNTEFWVFKGSDYDIQIHWLLKVYPDAKIIWVHNHVRETFTKQMQETISVYGMSMLLPTKKLFRIMAKELAESLGALDRLPKNQVYHLNFDDIARAPVETIRKIYHELEMGELSRQHERSINSYLHSHPYHTKPVQLSWLDAVRLFGMKNEQELFSYYAPYFRRFPQALK